MKNTLLKKKIVHLAVQRSFVQLWRYLLNGFGRFYKPWESIFIARYAKDILKKIPKILAGIEPGPLRWQVNLWILVYVEQIDYSWEKRFTSWYTDFPLENTFTVVQR